MKNNDREIEFTQKLKNFRNAVKENSCTKENFDEFFSSLDIYCSDFENELLNGCKIEDYRSSDIKDDVSSIKQAFDIILISYKVIQKYTKKNNIPIVFPQELMTSSQSILATYGDKSDIKKYKTDFIELNLPIKGFKHKMKLTTSKINIPCLIGGIIGLLICMILYFIGFVKDGLGYYLVRALASIVFTLLIVSFLDGFIKIKLKSKRYYIYATGALALFIFLYKFNPAKPMEYTPPKTNIENTETK